MTDELALVLTTPAEPPLGEYEVIDRNTFGKQIVARYPNGYGASVIQGPYSYGGSEGFFELAVLVFDGSRGDGYSLTYSTPITDDVRGWLTGEEVVALLHEVAKL